jgi:hypothetical protein
MSRIVRVAQIENLDAQVHAAFLTRRQPMQHERFGRRVLGWFDDLQGGEAEFWKV